MELRQLEYFREIADTGSIHEAARRLNMSQPPLSYQMRQLEDDLQVRLFERSSRGVVLTEAGKLLYARATNLLNYARSTKLEVAKTGKNRVLRLGITSTTVGTILPFIAAFTKKNPDVNFEVYDGSTYTQYDNLLEGIIEVSVARTPLRHEEVELAVLQTEPMIAVSSPKLQVDAHPSIRLSDLLDCPLILYRRYEPLIMEAFHEQQLEPDVFCRCDDARGAVLWVQEGLATAIFPQSMRGLCQGLHIRTLEEPKLETQIVLIWKKGRKPSPTVQEFLDLCLAHDPVQSQ